MKPKIFSCYDENKEVTFIIAKNIRNAINSYYNVYECYPNKVVRFSDSSTEVIIDFKDDDEEDEDDEDDKSNEDYCC